MGVLCTDVYHVPQEMLNTESDRSGGYREKLDQLILLRRGVEACCPALPLSEPVHVPDLG